MFGNFSQQWKNASNPANTLFAANAKVLKDIYSQQTQLVSGVISDSQKLIQSVASQTELKGLLAAQSVYAESLRERFASASKNTYSSLNTMREEVLGALQSNPDVVAKEAVVAEPKKEPVTKPATKTVAKKVVAKKVSSKPVTKKAVAKPVAKAVASGPKPQPSPEVPPKVKVAELKADEVKAPEKQD